MSKRITGLFSIAACFVLAFLFMLLWSSLVKAQPVQAGSGAAIVIPVSTIIPVMDGVCSPTEYSDAVQVTVTVGLTNTFPVFTKHTATDVYFCFGNASGLPLPNGAASSVAVYIDPDNDGVDTPRDDFGVWMPYDPVGTPFAHLWGTSGYDGADPGGWQAEKHQIVSGTPLWQVEFRISIQTIQGLHPIGLALFYHWWRSLDDDFSWPAPGIWGAPQLFGSAAILAPFQTYLSLTMN